MITDRRQDFKSSTTRHIMYSTRVKAGVFLLEALNALSTTCFFYYIYFFTQSKYGFDKFQNLLLAAGLGLIYAIGSVLGGRFAQRRGYFRTLKTGFAGMAAALGVGSQFDNLSVHLAVTVICNVAMSLTWPALEALISEGEPRSRLQNMVGIYNVVWSLCGALAYMTGGGMIQSWGLRSLFVVPGLICLVQLILAFWIEPSARAAELPDEGGGIGSGEAGEQPLPSHSPAHSKKFLRMAWLANPFAYLTINTVVAVSPNLAWALHLSPRQAGYFCSIWMFTRTAAFVLFWLWPGWHYRFRWLLNSYLGMILCFLTILLAPNLQVLVLSQIGFGLCLGLIYYSSLFYSMDVGETKGEHGGIHEAAIGVGSCAGPAIGAAALYFSPAHADNSTFAVGALLLLGLGGLVRLHFRK